LKIIDEPLPKPSSKKNRATLKRYGNQIVVCPTCGLKGIQKHWHEKSGDRIMISHPIAILRLDNPNAIQTKRTKRCPVGTITTDTWDYPKTDEGYQIVLVQLLEALENLVNVWTQKTSKTLTGKMYRNRSQELANIIESYQKFKPTMTEMEGLK